MTEECGESCSVVTSSSLAVVPPSNWWDLHGVGRSPALSPWPNTMPWHHHHVVPNPNSNSDEDVSISTSFTNASNHSGLTVESSHRLVEPAGSSTADDLIGPDHHPAVAASESHIWSHVLLNVGGNGDLQSQQDEGENFLDMLSSSKSMYELSACDYLKKLDNSASNNHWDQFSNSSSPTNNLINNNNNNFMINHHKPNIINGFNNAHHDHHANNNMAETERLSKLSNLISTWSIAPPEPPELGHADRHFISPQISLSSPLLENHHGYANPNNNNSLCGHLKQSGANFGDEANPALFPPCYAHNLKAESEHGGGAGEMEARPAASARALLRRPFNGFDNSGSNIIGSHQVGLINRSSNNMAEGNGKYHNNYNGMASMDSYAKNFADVISFSGRLGKPLMDIHGSNNNNNNNNNNKASGVKALSLSDSKKQGLQTSSSTRSGGRGHGNSSGEGKKKRSDDSNSETSLKKSKQESSTASSTKIQAPKVKIADRITALQQIVSPFGKTDTASVLYETIQYIKFLQEQVQLLSNPYMKTNSHKDPWGSLDRKLDHLKADHHHVKADLRSRGLCLVPVSCTPQVYRENTGSDYWTPTYRGCLYR